MYRVTLLRNLKQTQSCISGLSSSWLCHAEFTWLPAVLSQDNFSTHTGSSDIKTTTWSSASHFSRLSTQELALGYKPPIAERPFLPGSSSEGFPEFLPGPKEGSLFPIAYKVNNPEQFDVKVWSHVCRELVDAELTSYGAILIRNLPLFNMEDFKSFLSNLGYRFFEHGVTGYRTPLGDHVYTASDDPPEVTMEPHNECSYSPFFPKKIILFCLKEPDSFCGGETVLLKNRDLTATIDPEVIRKFEEKKVRYQAFLPNKTTDAGLQKSWQDRFWLEDPQAVEKILESNGWSFSWDQNKNLRFWYLHSPVILHPVTGEKIWFNQITSYHASYFRALPLYKNVSIADDEFPFHSYYGDGSVIEPAVLQHIRAAMWSCAIGFCWQTFDIAVLDNQQVLHGRMGWTGQRKLVTSLIDE